MDETIPLLVIAAVAIITVRWLFSKNNNAQTERGREMSHEELRRLQAMFPQIPVAIIRDEFSRSQSIQSCIDRLLQVSDRIASNTNSISSPSTLQNVNNDDDDVPLIDPKCVDRASWEQDAKLRQSLLKSRRAAIIEQARSKLRGTKDE